MLTIMLETLIMELSMPNLTASIQTANVEPALGREFVASEERDNRKSNAVEYISRLVGSNNDEHTRTIERVVCSREAQDNPSY
jgi:hypothetical protein